MKKIIKRTLVLAFALGMSALCLAGCKKKEPEGPVDAILTPLTIDMLQPGKFYIKTGESFYEAPFEDCNFLKDNVFEEAKDTTDGQNGIIKPDVSRIVDFTYEDNAIPTLYRNDQLVYISDGGINTFVWERFKDHGYSIGLCGLIIDGAGKISTNETTHAVPSSSFVTNYAQIQVPQGDMTINDINGTVLGSAYLDDAGVVTGMLRDSTAQIGMFFGTQALPISAVADTRFFKSFEIYNSQRYSLSTSGYAVVEVPDYMKSGYYSINNVGFFKFVNGNRGDDESQIDFEKPYFYTIDGKTVTQYEYNEAMGIANTTDEVVNPNAEQTFSTNVDEYPDRVKFTTDVTNNKFNISIQYKYMDANAKASADSTGKYPKVALLDPTGAVTTLPRDDAKTFSSNNVDADMMYITKEIDDALAGDWYLLFSNFENSYKTVNVDILSGNATSYLQNGKSGNITIYKDATTVPTNFIITWENTDRAASVKIKTPNDSEYSKEKTPESLITDEYGEIVYALPALQNGDYKIEVQGEGLGRVWVNTEEGEVPVVSNEEAVAETNADGTPVETVAETNADGTPVETSAESEGETKAE